MRKFRQIHSVLPEGDLFNSLLESGKKLNIYLGIDPTAPRIHLGHAVPLRLLQQFVERGDNVTLLFGDFTALIGDTSDKDGERPVLTSAEIDQNLADYTNQASKIIDTSKVKIVKNSEWLSKLGFAEIITLCQNFSVGDFVSRELIKKRLAEGKRVGLHETLYPVMQGYDSFKLKTDIQIGGLDQTFNMLAGRKLISEIENRESAVICTGYLPGTDGRKMSKSWGNAIWLSDDPNEMYGKIMSITDDLIIPYFELATKVSDQEFEGIKKELSGGVNPMSMKIHLAKTIVEEIHGKDGAVSASKWFEDTFQKKEPTYSRKQVTKAYDNISMFVSLIEGSMASAKRMIKAGAVEVNGVRVDNQNLVLEEGDKVKIGKRKFYKVSFE